MLTNIKNLNDPRVLQMGNRSSFRKESLLRFFGVASASKNHLEGDDSVQFAMTRLVDDPHTSTAEFRKHLIVTDIRKCRRAGRLGGRS